MSSDMKMTADAQYTACSYVMSDPGSQYASIMLRATGWNGLEKMEPSAGFNNVS